MSIPAVAIEDDVPINALSPDSLITLYLWISPELPDLPYNEKECHQSLQKTSKTLTFIEKDRTKNEIEILDLANPDLYTTEMTRKISSCDIEILNPLRHGKKLLILDLGYTLCDPDVTSFPSVKARRPHSSQLLTRAYRYYDIVIWSDMSREDAWNGLKKMGIIDDDQYKITFYLTVEEMIIVKTSEYGSVHVKPLEFIWRKFPRYTSKNTIIIDDNKWYFALNYQSGCEVKPYKTRNEELDVELEFLASYLEWIALFPTFENLNHANWRCPRKVFRTDNKKFMEQKRRFRVDVEWHHNRLTFRNVPGDVTAGELKYFVHGSIGTAVDSQVLLFSPANNV